MGSQPQYRRAARGRDGDGSGAADHPPRSRAPLSGEDLDRSPGLGRVVEAPRPEVRSMSISGSQFRPVDRSPKEQSGGKHGHQMEGEMNQPTSVSKVARVNGIELA